MAREKIGARKASELNANGGTQLNGGDEHSLLAAKIVPGEEFDPVAGALSIGDFGAAEGDVGTTTFTFTVTRTGGTDGAVSATWTLNAPGGATFADSGDFAALQPMSGTVSFADTVDTATITINVQGDFIYEDPEDFTVTLSAPTGGATLDDVTGLGTILNDDPAPPPPPAVDLDSGTGGIDFDTGAYTEDGTGGAIGAGIIVTGTLPITSATVTITDAFAGDLLALSGTLPATITVDIVNSTDTNLILLGVGASNADWEAALALVVYASNSENPTSYGTDTARTINVTVSDGVQTSTAAMATIAVTAVNDAPVLGGLDGDNVTFTEGDPYVVLDNNAPIASVTDPDNENFAGGFIQVGIQTGGTADDEFFVIDFFPGVGRVGNDIYVDSILIGAVVTEGPGAILRIDLNANATAALVATLLDYIGYRNASENPLAGDRQVTWLLNDGQGDAGVALSTVTVVAVNDAPVISGITGDTVTAFEDQAFALLDNSTVPGSVTDPDSGDFGGGFLQVGVSVNQLAEDEFFVRETGNVHVDGTIVNVFGVPIGVISDGGPGHLLTIDLNSNAIPFFVGILFSAIAYRNVSQDPIGGDRQVTWTVNDGDGGAGTALSTVHVIPQDDAPIVANFDGDSVTFTEGDAFVLLDENLAAAVSDVDNANFDGGNLAFVSFNNGQPEDEYFIVDDGNVVVSANDVFVGSVQIGSITSSGPGNALVITFNSDATAARVEALIHQIAYRNSGGDAPVAGDRTINWALTDGGQPGAAIGSGMVTVHVDAVNDAPDLDLDFFEPGVDAAACYAIGDLPVTLTPFAIFDDDNAGFDGATLTVSLTANGSAGDQLRINNIGTGFGEIGVSGNVISYEGVDVATFTGGTDGTDLVITFNAAACHCAIETVMENVNFEVIGLTPGTGERTISFTLVDGGGTAGGGADTATAEVTVDVTAPPHIHISAPDAIAVCDETLVNTTTAGDQGGASAAVLSDGTYVVAWQGADGVYFQQYDYDGTPLFGETMLDDGNVVQSDPNVIALADGGFALVYIAGDGVNPGNVWLQRFDSCGCEAGDAVQVGSGGINGVPQATLLAGGEIVVTWQSNSGNEDIHARVLDPTGAPVTAEFTANSFTANDQTRPDVAALANGGFRIVWTSAGQDGGGAGGLGVYSQSYDSHGNPVGGEFHINTSITGPQQQVVVTGLGGLGEVMVWQDNGDIVQRFRDPLTGVLSAELTVSAAAGVQSNPQVTRLDDGGYIITWVSAGQDGDGAGVYAQRFDSGGSMVGGTFLVNSTTAGNQNGPAVTALDDGYLLTWISAGQDGDLGGVYAQRYADAFHATEQVAMNLKGTVHISDLDTTGDVTVILSVAFGTLNVDPGTSGVDVNVLFPGVVELTGTVAEIEDLLNTNGSSIVTYTFDGDDTPPSDALFVAIDDGTSINIDTALIVLTAVNDAPVNTVPASPIAVTEDIAQAITGLSVADADIGFGVITVTLTVLHGTLTVLDNVPGGVGPGEITGNGTSTVTLQCDPEDVNATLAALNGVVYTPDANYNGGDTLTMTSNDGGFSGTDPGGDPGSEEDSDTVAITIAAVNDAPVLDLDDGSGGTGSSLIYTENDVPTLLLRSATVIDVDSANFFGGTLTVTFTAGGAAEDRLNIAAGNGISFSANVIRYNGIDIATWNNLATHDGLSPLVINLEAGSTPTAVQALLRHITYSNVSDAPSTTQRQLSVTISDGDGGTSTAAIATVDVLSVDDAPSGTDKTITFTEDTVYTFATADFGYSDNVDHDAFLAVRISFLPVFGTLRLNGNAVSAGDYIAVSEIAAGHFTYTPAPNGAGNGYALFQFQVQDDGTTANGGVDLDPSLNTITFNVTNVNDASTIDLNGAGAGFDASLAYAENDAATAIAPGATLADPDANLNGETLTISFTNGGTADDRLTILPGTGGGPTGGISFSGNVIRWNGIDIATWANTTTYDGLTPLVLHLEAGSTFSAVQALLRAIAYSNVSDNPSTAQRELSFVISGNSQTSNTAHATIDVTPVNDAPTSTTPAPVGVDPNGGRNVGGMTFADVDGNNFLGVYIMGIDPGVQLKYYPNGTGQPAVIVGSGMFIQAIDIGTLTVTFTANYTNFGPSYGFSYQVADDGGIANGGQNRSISYRQEIFVDDGNTAPINVVPGAQSFNEDGMLVFSNVNGNQIYITDSDAGGGDVTVTLTIEDGTLTLSGTLGLTSVTGNGTSAVALTGSLSEIYAALDGLTYAPPPNANGSRTLTIVTNDNGNSGTGGPQSDTDMVAITINAVNDAPVFTGLDANPTFVENGPAVVIDANATLVDLELAASGNYNGSTLFVQRSTGADTSDLFSFTGANVTYVGSDVAGTITSDASGTLRTVADASRVGGAIFVIFNANATQADVNAVMQQLTYANSNDIPPASVTLSYVFNDGNSGAQGSGGAGFGFGSVTVNITAVDDAPVNTVGGTATGNEDQPIVLTGISISDPDADPATAPMSFVLGVTHGTIFINTGVAGGITAANIIAGANGSNTISIVATQNQINATLADAAGLIYTPATNYNGGAALTITTSDQGATGIDPGTTGGPGDENDVDVKLITINPVNDRPVIAGLANNQSVVIANANEDVATAITGLSVSDVDVDPSVSVFAVTLTATHGILTLLTNVPGGLGAGNVTGNGTGAVSVSGTLDQVNTTLAAMNGLTFTSALNYNGAASVTITVDDQGAIGGGSLTATNVFTFNVDPVNDAPTVANLANNFAQFLESGTPALLDFGSNAVVGDVDSPNFGGGSLTIALTTGAVAAEDVLGIAFSGLLTDAGGGQVAYNGVTFATYTGGSNGAPLAFTFDDDATLAAVQALVRAISYANSNTLNPSSSSRTVAWTLVDGDGIANGGADTRNVTSFVSVSGVNDAPSGADNTLVLSEDGTRILALSDFGFSDVDGNSFFALIVSTLPTQGTLYLNGTPVAQDAFIFASAIAANQLTFVPAADGNGAAYASFTFQVVDNGGSGNGGSDTDQTPNTITFNVTAVNDAPINNVPGDQSTNEDVAKVFSAGNGNQISVADVDVGAGDLTVTLSVAHGTLTLSGTAGLSIDAGANGSATMTITGTAAAVNAALNGLSYTPALNYNGPDTLQITTSDNGNTGSGGALTDTDMVTITINAVNDAPSGTDATLTFSEDNIYTFSTTDFGFTDPVEGNSFQSVFITTLPANGTLTLSGVPVNAGDEIPVGQIGNLQFTPALNANGNGYASFTFQVRDNGGTANGGQDTDQTPNTITFNVTAVNDAPINTVPGAQSTNEDTARVFSSGNGNAISVADVDVGGGNLTVTLSVAHGALTLSGTAGLSFNAGANGSATMTITGTAAAINAALNGLTYAPAGNYNGPDTLQIQTSDNGNTGTGGTLTDTDLVAITIVSVNDAPAGTDKAVTINEDSSYVFATADFGFTDPNDGPANSLQAVSFTTLPTNGTLFYDADGAGGAAPVAVTAGQFISAAEIALGKVTFVPDANANGTPLSTFTFQVQDNGGTTNGGVDLDQSANSFTINVSAVNDAPVNAVPGGQSVNEDASLVLSTGNGNAIQVSDIDAGTGNVSVTLSVAHGTLTLASTAGLAFSGGVNGTATFTVSGTLAALNAALGSGLTYAPTANYNGPDAISVQTSDNGNSGSGPTGTDSDSVAITINSVNDAPSGADKIVTGSEDDPLVFTAADFGFTDPADGNAFLAVIIDSFPAVGSGKLFLDSDGPGGAAPVDLSTVGPGVFVSVTDINAGHLYFQPDPDEYGTNYASFTFRVQDDGGMLNGGVDRDPVANTITINVTPDNLPPAVDLNGAGAGIDYATTFVEDGAAVAIGAGIIVSDPDVGLGDLIESATITLTDKVTGDALSVLGSLPGGITANIVVNAGTIVVTLSGTASQADYATAIGQIRYATTNQDPTVGGTDLARTITVTVNDGTIDSAVATVTVSITPVDDAPVAQPDAFTITESQVVTGASLFANNGSGADSDPDGPALAISAVNGSAGNVGNQILLASGALLRVNANGTFDYDPNGAFLTTPTPGSGASNTPAHDSFTYTVAGGNTVTVSITLTGLDTDDILLGTAGSDMMFAGAGNDTLTGGAGDDQLDGGTGTDTALFTAANLIFTSTAIGWVVGSSEGNDVLQRTEIAIDGTGQRNLLVGATAFAGIQAAFDAANAGDFVRLANGSYSGTSTYSDANLTVIAQSGAVLNTTFTTAGTDGIRVYAADGADTITTGAGNDALFGGAGVDHLNGDGGNDYLDGGTGADVMAGGTGDDIYIVDNAGDVVTEGAGGGNDIVYASTSYALLAGAEVELLSVNDHSASAAINLTGNELGNVIYGNAGANLLDGGAGADNMVGFGGNDIFLVDNLGDVVVEGAGGGNDIVYASASYALLPDADVELLSVNDHSALTAINLSGSSIGNTIYGNAGANVLDGRGGSDALVGFGGADTFMFTTALGAGNVDLIADFAHNVDKIALDDAIFTTLGLGSLSASAFVTGTGALDADDRIIYNAGTGALYYDADGNGAGAQILFAVLYNAPTLTASDFTVI